jgi:hypothetical protein
MRFIRTLLAAPDYRLYLANDIDPAVNREAIELIKTARAAYDGPTDRCLRRAYERDMLTTLPEVSFEPQLLAKVAADGRAALADPALSPCAYRTGDQAGKQNIPKEAIIKDIRCYTKDVRAAIPDAPDLISPSMAHAIRVRIGSNFKLCDIILTRNYYVPPELNRKYDFLSDRWHFDHKYLDIFFLFVCLSNVCQADGPTNILSAPDSRALLAVGFNCSLREKDPNGGLPPEIIEGMPSLTRCCGPSGTKVLCHTSLCLHRAGTPTDPETIRDIMIFSFRHSPKMSLSWDAMTTN